MKLLSWGANSYGQLGQGIVSNECLSPAEVDISDLDLNLRNVVLITGGGGQSFVIQSCGHVFGCGLNNAGQLAHSRNSEIAKFMQIKNLNEHHIVQISCKWDSSFALTKSRECIAWGANTYGQLGIPPTELLTTRKPIRIVPYMAQQVEAGLRHCAIVTPEGYVVTYGDNRKGQLGRPTTSPDQHVPDLSNVRMVSCGQHHTLALTVNDRLYGWGCNKFGQLGLDPKKQPNLKVPTEIPTPTNSIDGNTTVISGWTHTALLTGDGVVINWGRNKYGQLGTRSDVRPIEWKPEVLKDIGKVRQLQLGSEHNLALIDDGSIMSWGWNEHGSCGVNHCRDVTKPVNLQLNGKALIVGTGAGHSFAVVH